MSEPFDEVANKVKGKQLEPDCHPRERARIAFDLSMYVPRFASTPEMLYNPHNRPQHHELVTKGYVQLPNALKHYEVSDVLHFLHDKKMYNSHVPFGDGVARDRVRTHQFWCYDLKDLLACPYLFKIATSKEMVNLAGAYLGCTPTLYSMNAWWSLSGFPERGTQSWHRDMDDFNFCSLFIYLTDIDANGGPHMYMEGTHRLDTLTRILGDEALAESMFPPASFNGYGHDQLYKDHLSQQIRSFCGEAGTTYMIDSFGLHRGAPALQTDRLVIWMRYGLHKNLTTIQTPYPHPKSLIHKDANIEWTDAMNYITRVLVN